MIIKTDRKKLISKLNSVCRIALEHSAAFCLSQTHYEVDIEHFILKLMDSQQNDFHNIISYFNVDESQLQKDINQTLDSFSRGNSSNPLLSQNIPEMIQTAWLIASINYEEDTLRSGHLILTMLKHEKLSQVLYNASHLFEKISQGELQQNFYQITKDSSEDIHYKHKQISPDKKEFQTNNLDKYTIDLTHRARKGEIDPVVGRDFEINQMIDILIRRRQNNPILLGDAGVGKTTVVEGFALKVIAGDVPPLLKQVSVRVLDLALLQAGAGIKGEFENRLKLVIKEVKSSPVPIILFIDEAHNLIGAGGSQGTGDAANLIKPALAKGELRTIAATTWSEYKEYFEKDKALARRFQIINVDEPDEANAGIMMREIVHCLEDHHHVITQDAFHNAVRLSSRYISGRKLPDKSLSVLDTACARVSVSLNATPQQIDHLKKQIDQINKEIFMLRKEARLGKNYHEKIQELEDRKKISRKQYDQLTTQWHKEKEIVRQIIDIRKEIDSCSIINVSIKEPCSLPERKNKVEQPYMDNNKSTTTFDDQEKLHQLKEKHNSLKIKLKDIQGSNPLIHFEVNSQTICEVISGWTGIPTGLMLTNEINTVLELDQILSKRIVGQDHALKAIQNSILPVYSGAENPSKPTGVFLLIGPSGVGKTETALALSDVLYGGERNIITINMSEYKEAHTVAKLKGAPPGFVGYGKGGILTEAVRRKPYSVILLDEVEKAHHDVLDLFYQVFDKGTLEDGEGRLSDFKNTIIIMTSNLGSDIVIKACADEETMPDMDGLIKMLKPELLKHFKPAFLGRQSIIPYFPISDAMMKLIIKLKLDQIVERMHHNRNIDLQYDEAIIDAIAARCTEVDTGARNVDHIISNTHLPEMARELLTEMAKGKAIKTIFVSLNESGFIYKLK